jgi:spore coat protein JB
MGHREKLLQQISEVSFTVNDLTLYLDTHPTDTKALEAISLAIKERKQLLQTYADQFEPLTMDCVCPDTNNSTKSHTKYGEQKHFTWADGPLPWEGGTF